MSDLLNPEDLQQRFNDLMHAILFQQYARTYWRENLLELTAGDGCSDCLEHSAGMQAKPCKCFYGLHDVAEAPVSTMVALRRPGLWRPTWVTRCFVIVWDCPHHGDAAYDWPAIQAGVDQVEAAFWSHLDEDERTGH